MSHSIRCRVGITGFFGRMTFFTWGGGALHYCGMQGGSTGGVWKGRACGGYVLQGDRSGMVSNDRPRFFAISAKATKPI